MAITKVEIHGKTVGIIDLEAGFAEVKALGITREEELKDVLFRKVQEKNYIPSGMEGLYREGLLAEYRIFTGEAKRESSWKGTPEIRLYGASCFNCEKLDEMVKGILSRAKIKADYLQITDIREVAQAGVMTAPALTVNGITILAGRMPSEAQLQKMLLEAIGNQGGS